MNLLWAKSLFSTKKRQIEIFSHHCSASIEDQKYQNKLSEEDHLMSTDVTIIIGTLPVWNEIISVN